MSIVTQHLQFKSGFLMLCLLLSGCNSLSAIDADEFSQPTPAVLETLYKGRPFRALLSTNTTWIRCSSEGRLGTLLRKCAEYRADLAALTKAAALSTTERNRHRRDWSTALLDLAAVPDEVRLEAIIQALRSVADSTGIAAVRNDLAVAYLLSFERNNEGIRLLAALDEIERAYQKDSASIPIRFNRALILNTAHLYEEAEVALADVVGSKLDSNFSAELRRTGAVAGGTGMILRFDTAAKSLTVAARGDPQGARDRILDYYLGTWSRATVTTADSTASFVAAQIMEIGQAIAQQSRDSSIVHIARDLSTNNEGVAPSIDAYLRGLGEFRKGNYSEAITPLAEASARLRQAGAMSLVDWNDLILAAAFMLSGDYDSGDRRYHSIRAHAIRRHETALEARASWGLALSAARRDHSASALTEYSRAGRLFESIGEWGNSGAMLSQASDVAFAIGRDDSAVTDKLQSLGALKRRRDASLRAGPVLALADQAAELQFAHAQIAVLKEAARSAQKSERVTDLAEAVTRLARAQAAAGQLSAAKVSLTRAHHIREQSKDTVVHARLSAELANLEASLAETDNPHEAVALLKTVASYYRDRKLYFSLPQPLIHAAGLRLRIGDTVGAIDNLNEALNVVEAQIDARVDAAQLRDLSLSRAKTFNQLAELRLSRGDTVGAFLLAERARGNRLREVPRLADGEIHLAYSVLPDAVLAWVVRSKEVKLVRVVVRSDSLTKLVRDFEVQIRTEGAGLRWEAISRALYHLLLERVIGHLGTARDVSISVDPVLGRLPFAGLRDSTAFVAERFAITYTRAIHLRRQGAVRRGNTLLVGNPAFNSALFPRMREIAESRREVDSIAVGYARPMVLIGASASKDVVLKALPGASLFHFAGHAQLMERAPARSHLVLAGQSGDVGENTITAAEVAKLRLSRMELVVLSSCGTTQQSGSGRASVQNGLADAFLSAGAKGVVSSGWEVDDAATARLMQVLHRELRTEANPAVALQRAQINALRTDGMDGVKHWSAFRFDVR